uniref:HTH_Tnp_Tc3_2 domain-containing protein n=1 Tax=Strongyloides venezuelensis TaxID=75913 RepID=A0A0K0FZB5_STRVS
MLSAEVRQKIFDYSREKSYRWIAKKSKIAHNTNRKTRSNAGRQRKLNKADELKIKRVTMDRIQKNPLVNSRIVKNELKHNVSLRTIQRKIKTMDFTDEKKFSVDGPDNLRSYQKNDVATLNLPKRKGKDGSIMVFGCMVYLDKFYLTKISSRMNSDEYIKLLVTEIFPFLKNNIKAGEREKYW